MSEQKTDSSVKLAYDNWNLWDRYIKSTIRRKNAYIAFDPEPVDPRVPQQAPQAAPVPPATTPATAPVPAITVTAQPTAEELKTYREELKEWKTANNVAAGVILGSISEEVEHLVNPEDSAKKMYDKLKTEILKQSSGSSAYSTRIELIYKKFKETLTFDSFKKHLTFYWSKNATLIAVGAGFDDSFLAFLLLHSFNSLEDPVWSMASTNIATSDIPINKWSFNQVAGKLREALRNSSRPTEASTSGNSQSALNAATNKPAPGRYSGPPCTYPDCRKPKTHPTDKCWAKEKDEKEEKEKKKKHKAKKAKKKAVESDSESESGSDPSESDSERTQKKHHHAKTIRSLMATVTEARAYRGKISESNLFVAHPDSGASNHMTHKMELFDQASFKKLSKPIPVCLGDDSEVFATGKGTIRLIFNVDGKKKEGKFKDVLYVPDLKVTLLSVGQSARLPHCKVVFDDNICEYIDKNTKEVIARAYASGSADLYTLDATPIEHKVAAKLASSSPRSIDINVLHRRLGHLGADNCRTMISRQLVDGVDSVIGKEEFCEGCAYGRSKRKPHPSTDTRTKRRLERLHVDICGPLPNSIGGNRYFLLIIDEHTHYYWVEFLSKKSDAFSRLRKWKLQAEREADLKLQYLKSDGGKEFGSKAFEEWLEADGVIHEMSAPYEHEQNGLAERGIQNISQKAMCQLFGANMLQGFWPYAVETAVYLINRSLTTTLHDKTPLEAWSGKRPNIRHLRTFGEIGYVHIPPETRKKWTKKSRPCRFLGYTPRSRNYKMWDPERRMVVVSPNVDFGELLHSPADPSQHLHGLRDAFGSYTEETPNVKPMGIFEDPSEWESDAEILRPKVTADEEVPNGPDPAVPLIPREPEARIRGHRRPEVERLADAAGPPPAQERRRARAAIGAAYEDVDGKVNQSSASVGVMEIKEKEAEKARKHAYHEALLAAEHTHLHNEPVDVNDAKQRPDWPKWEAAMQEELESLDRHGTYERVSDLPPGRKAIGYKWVFKLKLNPDNSIARYKARLVAKGYSQVPGQDFTETTSPVARLASYRALLSLAAKLNLEAHHLDIETAFLNGTLDEEIYMKAPDGPNTGKGDVWKLRKSLYGLKQASHVWNKLLDNTLKKLGFT